MARIYAIANQKGGVGKTTTMVNLGAYLAAQNQRVLLIDMDPQANATSSLGIDKRSITRSVYHALLQDIPLIQTVLLNNQLNLAVAPASLDLAGAEVELVAVLGREYRLREALAPVRDRFDYVLIDCPPSLGLLTLNALAAADGVLVPVQCEYLPLEGLSMLMRTIELVRARLNPKLTIVGLVMTMFDGRTNLSQQVLDDVRAHFPDLLFDTVIPRSVRLSEAPSHGLTIREYAPTSPGGLAYQALVGEVLRRDATLRQQATEKVVYG